MRVLCVTLSLKGRLNSCQQHERLDTSWIGTTVSLHIDYVTLEIQLQYVFDRIAVQSNVTKKKVPSKGLIHKKYIVNSILQQLILILLC